nr:hypothetical protein [Tanacetum cinerariifolium]
MIGSGYKSIHACEHDCCLFRGDDNKDLDFYPVCSTSRWKDSNIPRKKVPKKSGLQHVAGDIDNIQSASVVMYESSFMLTLLIPGPKSLGTDIDVYLIPLIEDLKVLWDQKVMETIDVASGQKFNMIAMALWTINDFSARSSLSGWIGQGYKACPTCNEDTPFVRVLSKTAYVSHGRFLNKPHKWRSSREFNGQTDNK